MKTTTMALVASLWAATASAQFTAGIYTGTTTAGPATNMLMADYGTALDIEPWIQNYGSLVQVGADAILTPGPMFCDGSNCPASWLKGIGVDVGVYSNPRTVRVGPTYTLPGHGAVLGGGQLRLMRTTLQQWQGVIYYNINLTSRLYLQPWLAPASDGGSAWLLGIGYTFKQP